MARLAWIGVLVLLAIGIARWLFPDPTGSSGLVERSRKVLPGPQSLRSSSETDKKNDQENDRTAGADERTNNSANHDNDVKR